MDQIDYTSNLTFHPNRHPTGMFRYVKSNLNKTKPVDVYVYYNGENIIEVLKIGESEDDAAYVTAEMDWNIFSATKMTSYWIYHDGSRKIQAEMEYNNSEIQGFLYSREGEKNRLLIPVSGLPFHIYNFDLISFIPIITHFKDLTKGNQIFLVDPVHNVTDWVDLAYSHNEIHNKLRCQKMFLSGPGLQNEIGSLWVHRNSGIVIDIEHPIPDNDSWSSFKFTLYEQREMNEESWKKLISEQLQSRLKKLE